MPHTWSYEAHHVREEPGETKAHTEETRAEEDRHLQKTAPDNLT